MAAATKEATLNAVETSLDVLENEVSVFASLIRNNRLQMAVVALTGAAVGGFTVWRVTKSKLEAKYSEISDREISEAKAFYGRLNKTTEETSSPEQVLESQYGKEAVEALRVYSGDEPHVIENVIVAKLEPTSQEVMADIVRNTKPAPKVNNIFDNSADEWDYERELLFRAENPNVPHIISAEEFAADENDYAHVQLTYFLADDVLVDDKDMPVNDTESLVGDDNLTRFGYGSGDKDLVYIRNDRLEMDMEVVFSKKSYASEVLGLEHSYSRKSRRFREQDE